MNSLLQKIVTHKRLEIEAAKRRVSLDFLRRQAQHLPRPRDFLAALKSPHNAGYNRSPVALIAEVKKASPSKGVIRANFEPVAIAQAYADRGADCLSVLTDEHFFQGHLNYLTQIRAAVELPLLRKDFVLDEYQVLEARVAGADAVLLIAECLEKTQLKDLYDTIDAWGMTPLIELYDEQNLDVALQCNPPLVGINNRDLHTFEVDFQRSIRLKIHLPADILVVSESGIETASDMKRLAEAGIGAALVGESLMRAADIGAAVEHLLRV